MVGYTYILGAGVFVFFGKYPKVGLQDHAAAHQAPPSLGFSRQEHWSGLPFSSPMHESEK